MNKLSKFSEDDLPQQLIDLQERPDDLSIIVGKNGSGKSTLLNELSHFFLNHGKQVIALANSVHDKFESGHKGFKTLRGRSGRTQMRRTLKKALQVVAKKDGEQRLKNATNALEYVGFHPVIGFKIENFSQRRLDELLNSTSENLRGLLPLVNEQKERIQYLFNKSQIERGADEIIWLDTNYTDFNSLEKTNLTELFDWEATLRKHKIISRIEVYLRKKDQIISMLEASSGELSLITSIVYVSTIINSNTTILVDEPENSLHPLWQKEYTKRLLDIFYYYQPKIIVATHSPLVVNGSELFCENVNIYKAENFQFVLQKKDPLNVEEIYFRFFDISTPQNRFLSIQVIRLLNLFVEEKMTLAELKQKVNEIKNISYDPKQINALDQVYTLAESIKEQ